MQVEIPYFLLYGINYKDTGTFPYMHSSVAIHTFKDAFLCTFVTQHEKTRLVYVHKIHGFILQYVSPLF